jgi:RimJ/RimL family protein N-acetyltransferase
MELINVTQEHFPILISWFPTLKDLIQWGGPLLRFPLDDSQIKALQGNNKCDLPDKRCWMARHEGALVGHAQLVFDWNNGNAALCKVAIAPAFRGQKLAAPMLQMVMAKAFNYPQIVRLELNVFSFNHGAIHTYKKLGFLVEGIKRSSVAVGDERWDLMIMSILRSEYSAKLSKN